jgi:hypothetical protein
MRKRVKKQNPLYIFNEERVVFYLLQPERSLQATFGLRSNIIARKIILLQFNAGKPHHKSREIQNAQLYRKTLGEQGPACDWW